MQEIERSKLTIQDLVDTNLSESRGENLHVEEEALFDVLTVAPNLEISMISFDNFTSLKGKGKSLGPQKIMSDFKSLFKSSKSAKGNHQGLRESSCNNSSA